MLTVEIWVIFIWAIKCDYQILLVKGCKSDIGQITRKNINNLNILGYNAVFEKIGNASSIGFQTVEDTYTFPFFWSRVVSLC